MEIIENPIEIAETTERPLEINENPMEIYENLLKITENPIEITSNRGGWPSISAYIQLSQDPLATSPASIRFQLQVPQ